MQRSLGLFVRPSALFLVESRRKRQCLVATELRRIIGNYQSRTKHHEATERGSTVKLP